MSPFAVASRSDVRNSLTEKCESCTIRDPSDSTIAIKLKHEVRSACSSSSQRQFGFSFGIPSSSRKLTARTSASSSTRSGQIATTRHCNTRRAWSRFGFLISLSTRSYVSSKDSGNSSRVHRTLDGRHCRSTSNWQNIHRNLVNNLNKLPQTLTDIHLHSISPLGEHLNDKLLILCPPSPHDWF